MVKFEGNLNEFIDKISINKIAFLKKANGKKIYWLWWEDSEKWFLNIAIGTTDKHEKSYFITKNDANKHLSNFMDEYKMYIKN